MASEIEKHPKVTLYHWPQSRSVATHYLLEELGATYELKIHNIEKKEQKSPDFLRLNPMGKIPSIVVGDVLVTESTAILIYLSDLFADRGLTPGINDPLRGPYLRWIAFYAACFEPALTERALKHSPGDPGMVPWGSFDDMWNTLTGQLSKGPYMLGNEFYTLDVLWGSGLAFMDRFGLTPKNAAVTDYINRVTSRPSFARVDKMSERILAENK